MDINQMVNEVNSKESFLELVRALAVDWEEEQRLEMESPSNPYGSGAKGWENGTVGAFLEAMHAWAIDSKDKVPPVPTWRTFSELLRAGKYYE